MQRKEKEVMFKEERVRSEKIFKRAAKLTYMYLFQCSSTDFLENCYFQKVPPWCLPCHFKKQHHLINRIHFKYSRIRGGVSFREFRKEGNASSCPPPKWNPAIVVNTTQFPRGSECPPPLNETLASFQTWQSFENGLCSCRGHFQTQ